MASIKLSNLTETTGYTYDDIVALVNYSGGLPVETKKITAGHLFNNTPSRIDDQTSQDTNTFIGAGSDVNSSSTESVFQGSTKYSGVMFGIGQMNNSSDSVIAGSTGGASSVIIDGSSATGILGGFRSNIYNSTRCFQIGSQDVGHNTNLNSTSIGVDGGQIQSSYKATTIGSGNSNITNSTEAFIAGSRNSGINLAGGNSGVVIGSKSGSISLTNPSAEVTGIYSSNNATINTTGPYSVLLNTNGSSIGGSTQGASMVSTDSKSAIHDWTLHTDNLYSWGRIQSDTEVSTTISNVQTLSGGLGMVQYTDVASGNLNLQIDDVRNGEVYHWVIDNQTGGSISISSLSTNTGFTITDNASNTLTTGPHIFTIVVVNNKIIVEGTH